MRTTLIAELARKNNWSKNQIVGKQLPPKKHTFQKPRKPLRLFHAAGVLVFRQVAPEILPTLAGSIHPGAVQQGERQFRVVVAFKEFEVNHRVAADLEAIFKKTSTAPHHAA